MKVERFALERYFARHEFNSRHLLSASDCEALSLQQVLSYADDDLRRRFRGLTLGYTESQGLPELRAEIAGLYERQSADDVLVVVPEEGILLTMLSLLNPGDHVVCTYPAYESLFRLAEALGCRVSLWTPEEARAWRFDPATLERLLRPDTRLVVVNFPHNPTGYLPPAEDLAAILALATRRGAYVLSDEMYRLLELDPKGRLPSASDLYERAVSLSGMSKSFGMPGIRLGWLTTRDPGLMMALTGLKDYTTICGSAPSELLALAALRARGPIVSQHLERIGRNLGLLSEFMGRQAHLFSWWPPRAGSVCFPRLLLPEGATAFCERLQEEAGLMLVPAGVFAFGDAHVRIGLGREDFPQALAEFDEYLEARYPRRN